MMKKYSFADMQRLHWKDYEFECQRLTFPNGRQIRLTDSQNKQVQTKYNIITHRAWEILFSRARGRGHGYNFTGMVAAVAGGLR